MHFVGYVPVGPFRHICTVVLKIIAHWVSNVCEMFTMSSFQEGGGWEIVTTN